LQTTLLGLAIAIILALVAALVGPLLIDWGGYRSIFEAEASHLIGVDVRVTGEIDARLLPSPRLTLHGIEVGRGKDKIRARSLGIEFALTPLMRGDWRATDLHLDGPQITLATDASGKVKAPAIAVAFDPDALTVERLAIENGKITFADAASGSVMTLDRLWFNGEARSLLGPFKGEGAVTIAGELYPFRLSSGRYSDAGTIKLHVNVDPVNRPLSIETDGVLTVDGGAPHFDGILSLAKPVGIAAHAAGRLAQPWRLNGKLKVNPQSALFEQVEYQYGSDEQGLKLTGVADFKFGPNPRFDGVLSGRQIDLDRVLVADDGSRPPPAAALRELVELGGGAFRPAFPIQIGVGIDQITLGGNAVQNLRGDISTDADGWNLDRFEFRAPGFTQVRLSGHLAVGADGVAFTGPAEIDANDPKALAAWLEGRGDKVASTPVSDLRPLSLRGEVTLGSEKIAVERLRAEFDRKTVSGRLAYVFASGGQQAKLDAALNAPELDIDAALGFGKALLAGSTIERPHDMTIAADIGRATVGGFVARNASARLKVDASGLQIDKLAVADLGGAAFSASGRIVTTAPSPQGSINVDLTAPDMAPVLALLARFAPTAAHALERRAAAMAPAKLRARLVIDGTAPAATAKLGVDGSLGKVRIALNAQGDADMFVANRGELRLDGTLQADDGKMLLAMLGLDRVVDVDAGPGILTVTVGGPASGDLHLDGHLNAKGLEAKASGTVRPFAASPSLALHANVIRADAAPLRGPGGGRGALPASFDGQISLAGDNLTIADINANAGATNLRGKIGLTLTAPYRLQGDIEADNIDGASVTAAAIGMPSTAPRADKNWIWSSEPFIEGAFGDFAGTVSLKVRRLEVSPQLTVRAFRTALRFGRREIVLDDMAGVVAGGRFAGSIVYNDSGSGLTAKAKLSLAGADVAVLLPAGARPPVTGSLDIAAEVEGSGLSPVALIGSLQGNGRIVLADAQLAGLDPRAFDAVSRAVDQGLTIDTARIANVVRTALESGQLSVKRAEGGFSVSAGQVRLSNVSVDSTAADLSLSGSVDLTEGILDARMVLSGAREAAGARPDNFMALKGPVSDPSRSIDVSALTGWLTLRAVENQARKLREIEKLRDIEAARPRPVPPPVSSQPNSATPNSPPPVSQMPVSALPGSTPKTETVPLPRAPKSELAPALPPPVDVKSLPVPSGASQPAASVNPQN
jgi:large subunit ribosomal protein L24